MIAHVENLAPQNRAGGSARLWGRPALQAAREALGLLVPVECAGCGCWDTELCDACRELLTEGLQRCDDLAPLLEAAGLPTWSLGDYRGPLRAMLLAWKSGRRPKLAAQMMRAGRLAGHHLVREAHLAGANASLDTYVVAAPSGIGRRLARRLVARELAGAVSRGIAEELARLGTDGARRVVHVDALRRRPGGRRHLAGAGARERARIRRGRIYSVAAFPSGAQVVLVDDVVTTGATLMACRRALRGNKVVAALALASTPAPGQSGLQSLLPGGPLSTDRIN